VVASTTSIFIFLTTTSIFFSFSPNLAAVVSQFPLFLLLLLLHLFFHPFFSKQGPSCDAAAAGEVRGGQGAGEALRRALSNRCSGALLP